MMMTWMMMSVLVAVCTAQLRGGEKKIDLQAFGWTPSLTQEAAPLLRREEGSAPHPWLAMAPIPGNMSSFGIVQTETGLVVTLGGYSSSADPQQLVNTFVFDPSSAAAAAASGARADWTASADLTVKRTDLSASLAPALGQGIAMAIGGFTGLSTSADGITINHYTSSVETLDTTTGAMVDLGVPDYPSATGVTGSGAAALPNGQVVAVGGFIIDSSGVFKYLQDTYVLTADSSGALAWERGPDFPWARSGLMCSSVSTGVLCMGGGNTDPAYSDAALFDGTTWTKVPSMNEARNWASATTAHIPDEQNVGQTKEVVYMVGGFCCSSTCFFSPLPSVEYYDVSAGVWVEAAPMPLQAAAGGAASVPTLVGAAVMAITGSPSGDVVATVNP
jgi:hypothetical protein